MRDSTTTTTTKRVYYPPTPLQKWGGALLTHTTHKAHTMSTLHTIPNSPFSQYRSVDSFIRENKANGYHFFDPKTMRAWGTRVHDALYSGCVFVTSDHDARRNRVYSVRITCKDGSVHTTGMGKYSTREQAHRVAKQLGKDLISGACVWDSTNYKVVQAPTLL